jgi:hypothetical protein
VLVALSVPTVGLLYSVSLPGFDFAIGGLSVLMLAAASAIWLLALAVSVVRVILRARRERSGEPGPKIALRRYLFAPIAAAVLVGVVWADAPLRFRFELSRSSFDDAVARLPRGRRVDPTDESNWKHLGGRRRIGLFQIMYAERVGEILLFFEETGDFLDDAGFAHLPHGPDPRLGNGYFENPQFTHLTGHWYSFTSSW